MTNHISFLLYISYKRHAGGAITSKTISLSRRNRYEGKAQKWELGNKAPPRFAGPPDDISPPTTLISARVNAATCHNNLTSFAFKNSEKT